MREAKKLAEAVSLSAPMFKEIEKYVFSDFRKKFSNERDHAVNLAYALHYVKDIGKNSDINVKRILDSVGSERNERSNIISGVASKLGIRNAFVAIDDCFKDKSEEGIKNFLPDLLQSIYDADDISAESLILRGFETLTKDVSPEEGLAL